MCRTAGALFLFGGAVNAVLLVSGSGSFRSGAVLAVLSAGTGVWLLFGQRRLAPGLVHFLLGFATLLIAAETVVASDAFVAIMLAMLSVFVSAAAFFFPWAQLVGHLALSAICTITAVAVHPGIPWQTGVAISAFVVALTVINKLFLDMAVAAEFDALTGLPNRRGFDRHVASWLGRAQYDDAALILIGVRAPGNTGASTDVDAALPAVLDSWRPVLNTGEKLGRRDVDQIAILLPGATAMEAMAFVDRLKEATTCPFVAGLTTVRRGDTAAELIGRVERALLRAKSARSGHTVVDVVDAASDASRLRRALARGDLHVGYQPIVLLSPGYPLVAVEALLRWTDSALSPAELVGIAERSGFIAELDEFVLRRACREASTIRRVCGRPDLMLNVNVSAASLIDGDLFDRVESVLADTDWAATELTIEVTEEMLDLRGGEALTNLARFRALGGRIAVDDFGKGYSSLNRLQALPVDMLKLDKTITDSASPAADEPPTLLRAVAAMAGALDLPVTVEGVETRRQLAVLTDIGFEQAQGFLFGAARDLEAFTDLVVSEGPWWDPDRRSGT